MSKNKGDSLKKPVRLIYLSRDDGIDAIAALLGKINGASAVWLVAPWHTSALRKLLNLKRLERLAEEAALDLRLVSRDGLTRRLARETSIPVYLFAPPSAKRGQVTRRRNGTRIVDASPQQTHQPSADALSIASTLLLLVVLLGAFALSLALFLPQAKVIVEPISQSASVSYRAIADPAQTEVDYSQAIIPARRISVHVEGHGQTPATGRTEVADAKATGYVVFANRTNQEVVIPEGTVVRTSSGVNVRFYTLAEATVPGQLYAHVRVPIIAQEPGPTGNVRRLTINVVEGEIANQVDVLNDDPTEGGSMKDVPVVEREDFDRLHEQMTARLHEEAFEKIVSELEETEAVPPDSLELENIEREEDQRVKQQNAVASAYAELDFSGIAYDQRMVEDLSAAFLEEQAEQEAEVVLESLQIDVRDVGVTTTMTSDVQGSRALELDIDASAALAQAIDKDRISGAIRGKPAADAVSWLQANLDLRQPPTVELQPAWWPRLPWLPARIEIRVSAEATE